MGRLGKLLEHGAFLTSVEVSGVEGAIRTLVEALSGSHGVAGTLAGEVTDALLAREALASTGLGDGVAVPHAYVDGLRRTYLVIATLTVPIDFKAADEQPVDVLFLLIGTPGAEKNHLGLIARIARLLHHPDFPTELRAAATPEDGLAAVERVESRHP